MCSIEVICAQPNELSIIAKFFLYDYRPSGGTPQNKALKKQT